MEADDYVRSIRSDGLALAEAADDRLEDSVPSCPGWTVSDLVWHVGAVHRFWSEIAGRQLLDPEEVAAPARPEDLDLLAWYEGRLAELLAVLEAADPQALVWSWASPDPLPTAWIQRRMAQETAVHRWDAQDAAGARSAIETEIAVDGIDEFLYQFVGLEPDDLASGGETVGFQASDTGDGWVARVAGGELDVRPTSRAGSLIPVESVARGSASDLLLLLWRRLRLDALEVEGDRAAMARFLLRADLR